MNQEGRSPASVSTGQDTPAWTKKEGPGISLYRTRHSCMNQEGRHRHQTLPDKTLMHEPRRKAPASVSTGQDTPAWTKKEGPGIRLYRTRHSCMNQEGRPRHQTLPDKTLLHEPRRQAPASDSTGQDTPAWTKKGGPGISLYRTRHSCMNQEGRPRHQSLPDKTLLGNPINRLDQTGESHLLQSFWCIVHWCGCPLLHTLH